MRSKVRRALVLARGTRAHRPVRASQRDTLDLMPRIWPNLPMLASRHFMRDLNSVRIRKRPGQLLSRHCVKLPSDRMDRSATARDQQPSSDPVTRLERLADALSTRGTILKGLADTLAPLYQSFDDGQKRRFTVLARFMLLNSWQFGMWQHETYRRDSMRGGDNFHHDRYRFNEDEETPD